MKRVQFNSRIPQSHLDRLNEMRGDLTQSEFLMRLIDEEWIRRTEEMSAAAFNFRTGEHIYEYLPHPHGGKFAAWEAQDGPGPSWLEGERDGEKYTPQKWEREAWLVARNRLSQWPVVRDDAEQAWEWDGKTWVASELPTSADFMAAFADSGYKSFQGCADLLVGKSISKYAMARLDKSIRRLLEGLPAN